MRNDTSDFIVIWDCFQRNMSNMNRVIKIGVSLAKIDKLSWMNQTVLKFGPIEPNL